MREFTQICDNLRNISNNLKHKLSNINVISFMWINPHSLDKNAFIFEISLKCVFWWQFEHKLLSPRSHCCYVAKMGFCFLYIIYHQIHHIIDGKDGFEKYISHLIIQLFYDNDTNCDPNDIDICYPRIYINNPFIHFIFVGFDIIRTGKWYILIYLF